MDLANGTILTGLTPDQRATCDLLRETLVMAEQGQIDTIGVVACLKGGFATVIAGRRAGDLMLGAFDLQCKIRDATQGSLQTRQASRLVRPR